MYYAAATLLTWNVVVFAVYGLDKRSAKARRRRLSEKTLLLCAFAMGGLGAALGMGVFRHKTRHTRFTILVPLALLLNAALCAAAYLSAHGALFPRP